MTYFLKYQHIYVVWMLSFLRYKCIFQLNFVDAYFKLLNLLRIEPYKSNEKCDPLTYSINYFKL